MIPAHQALKNAVPQWRDLLQLGEELLSQPNAAAQIQTICDVVQQKLDAEAKIWLARPFYPLPGEPEVPLLPNRKAPEIVKQVIEKQDKYFQVMQRSHPQDWHPDAALTIAALPILTQNNLLGVLMVTRTDQRRFEPQHVDYLEGVCAHAAVALQISRQISIKNWRNEQLSLVRTVSSQIATILDLNELCQRVTQLIQQTFNFYYVAIFTLEADGQTLRNRASASLAHPAGTTPIAEVKMGEGIIGLVAQDGIELLAPDVRVEPYFRHFDSLPETRSEVALPLKVENRVLGILDVQSDQMNGFHEIDMMVLRSLADNISLAIQSAQLYDDVESRAEQMALVYRINHVLNSILDLDELLEQVVELIQKHFGHPYVHLFTVHSGRRKVIFRAGIGERSRQLGGEPLVYELDDPRGIIPYVARTGESLLSNDVSRQPLYRPSPLPPDDTQSELSVPLSSGGEVLGVLDLQSKKLNAFTENDRGVLESLAAGIGIAIRNATLYRTEKWRHQVAESFREVAGKISANNDLEQIWNTILSELERNLPCDASAIWLLDEPVSQEQVGDQVMRLAAAHGADLSRLSAIPSEDERIRGWLNRAARATKPIIRRAADPYGPLGAALDFPADYSSIAAPLRSGEQRLGVLTIAHHTAGRYGSEARALLSTFASYAAVAIQNARLYSQAQEQAWIATILLQVSEATQGITSLDELHDSIVRLLPLLLGVKVSGLLIWEETLQMYRMVSQYGMSHETDDLYITESSAPALAKLRERGEMVFINDVQGDLNLPDDLLPTDIYGLAVVPLLARGNPLGALLIGLNSPPETISSQMQAIVQGIAHQTAVTLENLRLIESSQEEAYVTAVLLQVAEAVVSQNELTDILETITSLMPILVGIDTCAIYLWDSTQQMMSPASANAAERNEEIWLREKAYGLAEFPLLEAIYQNDRPFSCELDEEQLHPAHWPEVGCSPSDELRALADSAQKEWLMGFPLSVKGEVYGVLVTKASITRSSAQSRRMEIINGIAQQTALAVQNELYKQKMVERERLEREIQLARQIQRTFLPSKLPNFNGWALDSRWQTARQVGGDFYDIIRLGNDRLGLVIADVSDKGLPAALYMTVTRSLIRANLQGTRSPSAVLQRVNRQLASEAPNGMFITTFYAVLSLSTGELTFTNAGHNRPLLRSQGGQVTALPKGGMALGVLPTIELTDHTLTLQPGDSLILYTDGVTESFSPDGEAFGEERLSQLIAASSSLSVNDLLDHLGESLVAFRAAAPPSDDVTLLAIQRLE